MSRLKLILLLLIIAALGVVFFQNREPIALKMLCPDNTQACIYQTPPLPLAVWICLFTFAGIVTSLLWQMLERYRYSGSAKRKYTADDVQASSQDWYREDEPEEQQEQDRYSASSDKIRDTTIYSSTSYEKPQEPESVESSGSTYSYRYKDKEDDNNNQKPSIESDINLDKEDDDEDWI